MKTKDIELKCSGAIFGESVSITHFFSNEVIEGMDFIMNGLISDCLNKMYMDAFCFGAPGDNSFDFWSVKDRLDITDTYFSLKRVFDILIRYKKDYYLNNSGIFNVSRIDAEQIYDCLTESYNIKEYQKWLTEMFAISAYWKYAMLQKEYKNIEDMLDYEETNKIHTAYTSMIDILEGYKLSITK